MHDEEIASVEEQLAALLAGCDEALAAGKVPTLAAGAELPAELRARLERGLGTLCAIRRVFPETPGGATVCRAEILADEPGESAPPFRRLGRFQIRRELGRGAYGLVFLAYDPRLCREVALKVPHGDALLLPEQRARFVREARAAAALDHPNLVPIYEADEVGPVCYIASAYCPGGTLADLLARGGPLPARLAAELVCTLALALQHAHDRAVLHRDLKPSNVLLQHSPDGGSLIPRVTDFGTARLGPPGETLRTPGSRILGTPNYVPPEQVGEALAELGPAADVYSLGAILYECLAGRPPFQAEELLELLQQVKSHEPLPPTRLRQEIPAELEKVCLKCLQKNPARRYPSAAALADDLRRFLAGEPAAQDAAPPAAAPQPPRTGFRPWSASLLILGGLLLGLGTAAALFDRDAIRGPAGRGELFIETDREAQVILKRDGRLVRILDVDESRAFDLAAGEYEAEAVEVPDRGRLRVGPFLVPRGGREVVRLRFQPSYPPVTFPLTLSGHAAPVWGVAFSPDGKTLASVSGRNAKLWDLTTGKEAATLEDGSAAFMSVAFSPDGKTVSGGGLYSFVRTWDSKTGKLLRERHVWGEVRGVAYTANDRLASASVLWSGPNGNVVRGDLQIWDPATGRDKVTFETEPGIGQLCVACSPDGTLLAAASGRYDSKMQRVVSAQVKVWDASSGKAVATLGGYTDAIGNVAFSPDGKRLAVASWDNSLDVWEVASRRKLFSCRGHAGGVFAVCFSRDGKRLASGGRDGTVRVWDAATGSERRCLRGHASGVPGVAFSPDGTRLASAGQEGTVRVWDVHLAE